MKQVSSERGGVLIILLATMTAILTLSAVVVSSIGESSFTEISQKSYNEALYLVESMEAVGKTFTTDDISEDQSYTVRAQARGIQEALGTVVFGTSSVLIADVDGASASTSFSLSAPVIAVPPPPIIWSPGALWATVQQNVYTGDPDAVNIYNHTGISLKAATVNSTNALGGHIFTNSIKNKRAVHMAGNAKVDGSASIGHDATKDPSSYVNNDKNIGSGVKKLDKKYFFKQIYPPSTPKETSPHIIDNYSFGWNTKLHIGSRAPTIDPAPDGSDFVRHDEARIKKLTAGGSSIDQSTLVLYDGAILFLDNDVTFSNIGIIIEGNATIVSRGKIQLGGTTTLTVKGSGTLQVFAESFVVNGSGSLALKNNCMFVTENLFDFSGGGSFTLDNTTGKLSIYTGSKANLGSLTLIGGSLGESNNIVVVSNAVTDVDGTNVDANNASVICSGATGFTGIVYAPNASVLFSGAGTIYGSVIAQSIRLTGAVTLTYDESLKNNEDTVTQ